jgi:tRNA(Ile)-lysidine synthase
VPGLTADAFAVFDHYLNGDADQPVGVAVSGGGDSVALLYLLAEWNKRPLEVFCVDHGLNPQSPAWTESVARHAAAVGAGFTALHWRGDKPSTGLSAAARDARHALLADAARQKGVRVLCLAHTRDDILEAQLMRAQGSNVGTPRPWSPSPAWPQGRGVFLLRPLLDHRREALREWLPSRGLSWIDDPANDSAASLRARTRKALRENDSPLPTPMDDAIDLTGLLRDTGALGAVGQIVFDAANFASRPPAEALRLLAAAAVSAGGGNRLPRRDRVAALYDRLATGEPATLSGARIQQMDGSITFVREAGDIGRHGTSAVTAAPGQETVWDGRFAVVSPEPAVIRSGKGLRAGLSAPEKAWLGALPASMRDTLPVLTDGPKLWLPEMATSQKPTSSKAFAACWVSWRFLAACGALASERDLQGLYSGGQNGL